jgi:hypothetical protein
VFGVGPTDRISKIAVAAFVTGLRLTATLVAGWQAVGGSRWIAARRLHPVLACGVTAPPMWGRASVLQIGAL